MRRTLIWCGRAAACAALTLVMGCPAPIRTRSDVSTDEKAAVSRGSALAPIPSTTPTGPRAGEPVSAAPKVGNLSDGPVVRRDPPVPTRPAADLFALADDFTVAEVGGTVIKFAGIYDVIADELRRQRTAMPLAEAEKFAQARFQAALDAEIQDLLFFEDAWKGLKPEQLEVVMTEVEKRLKTARTAAGSDQRWASELKSRGLSPERLKELLTREVVINYTLQERFGKRLTVRRDELVEEYAAARDRFRQPGGVRFRVLEISRDGPPKAIDGNDKGTPEQVRDFLAARLAAGADFLELVKKYSDYRPADGGYWRDGALTPLSDLNDEQWRTALAKLKPGTCTTSPMPDIAKTGWAFLKLEERLDGEAKPLEAVSDELTVAIRERKMQALWEAEIARLQARMYVGRCDASLVAAALRRRLTEMP